MHPLLSLEGDLRTDAHPLREREREASMDHLGSVDDWLSAVVSSSSQDICETFLFLDSRMTAQGSA